MNLIVIIISWHIESFNVSDCWVKSFSLVWDHYFCSNSKVNSFVYLCTLSDSKLSISSINSKIYSISKWANASSTCCPCCLVFHTSMLWINLSIKKGITMDIFTINFSHTFSTYIFILCLLPSYRLQISFKNILLYFKASGLSLN